MRRHPRRRNRLYGATSSDYRDARWNPRQGHTVGHAVANGNRSGVLLGSLDELVIREPDGEILDATPGRLKGLFLAWMPGDKALAIVRKTRGKTGHLGQEARRIHRMFHDTEPTSVAAYDRPTKDGSEYKVGLIESLTYVVPEWVSSPEKHGAKWVHKFGDHGEEGHGPVRGEKSYSDSLKPYLLENADGDLFIQRRPGNKYDVTKWIYW